MARTKPFVNGPVAQLAEALRLRRRSCGLESRRGYFMERDDHFDRHLKEASRIVASWPAWKRNVLGSWSVASYYNDEPVVERQTQRTQKAPRKRESSSLSRFTKFMGLKKWLSGAIIRSVDPIDEIRKFLEDKRVTQYVQVEKDPRDPEKILFTVDKRLLILMATTYLQKEKGS